MKQWKMWNNIKWKRRRHACAYDICGCRVRSWILRYINDINNNNNNDNNSNNNKRFAIGPKHLVVPLSFMLILTRDATRLPNKTVKSVSVIWSRLAGSNNATLCLKAAVHRHNPLWSDRTENLVDVHCQLATISKVSLVWTFQHVCVFGVISRWLSCTCSK